MFGDDSIFDYIPIQSLVFGKGALLQVVNGSSSAAALWIEGRCVHNNDIVLIYAPHRYTPRHPCASKLVLIVFFWRNMGFGCSTCPKGFI
jgi:hypothetical protein